MTRFSEVARRNARSGTIGLLPLLLAVAVPAGCERSRAACAGDDACAADQVCWFDGFCLLRDTAVRLGGLGSECAPDLECDAGRCWAGYCVVLSDGGTASDCAATDGGDGAIPCGDGLCDTANGETCTGCAQDCPVCCGDGLCEAAAAETCTSCGVDCGACCGDGTCDIVVGEGCDTCPADCGACAAGCGDGWCDTAGGENCATCGLECPCCGAAAVPPPGVDFATAVQTILSAECAHCHVAGGGPNGLDLTTYGGVIAGGDNGSEVVPCDCASSNIWNKTGPTPPFGVRMPADGPPYLSDAQRLLICDWINQGADLTYTPWACGGPPSCNYCGDGACVPLDGEDCTTCVPDCGACLPGCGNGTCEPGGGETCVSCSMDCAFCCGNGTCEVALGETCTTCAADCSGCCGDGTCGAGETCSGCTADCGACTDTAPPAFAGLDLTSELGATDCMLEWDPAVDNLTPSALIVYEIYVTPEGTPFDFSAPFAITPAGAATWTITLAIGPRYDVIVRAVDQSGNRDANSSIEQCDMRP